MSFFGLIIFRLDLKRYLDKMKLRIISLIDFDQKYQVQPYYWVSQPSLLMYVCTYILHTYIRAYVRTCAVPSSTWPEREVVTIIMIRGCYGGRQHIRTDASPITMHETQLQQLSLSATQSVISTYHQIGYSLVMYE